MISVIIPAHNEEEVIGATLSRLLLGVRPAEVELLVVCNGCSDNTAAVAKGAGECVRVIESPIPSKAEAINTGIAACAGDHIVVMDADVSMSIDDLRGISAGLLAPGVMAAAPCVEMRYLPGTSWGVRAFYRFWMSLSYVKEGMMAAGVWAVNAAGRERLGVLPRIISDDGYARLLFSSTERVEARGAVSRVLAPLSLADLVKIKTRSRLGWYELRSRFPDLLSREAGSRDYSGAWLALLARPTLWPAALPYVYVNLLSRWRARAQSRDLASYRWERDQGSRRAFAEHAGGAAAARKD